MIGWRLSLHAGLDGFGGTVAGGRWHSRGRPVVYAAECAATALLEILVHLEIDREDLPQDYRLLRIDIPDDVSREEVRQEDLPADWRERPAVTRGIGDTWLREGRSAVLAVPCAIIRERNLLLNPAHPDAARVTLAGHEPFAFDARLAR